MQHQCSKGLIPRALFLGDWMRNVSTYCESRGQSGKIQYNRSCATIRISQTQFLATNFAVVESGLKAHTDRTWFGNATFRFSMAFNFNNFLCFSNIRNHLSNFSYFVCISGKIFIRWRFYLFLKTENLRRVVESRPVCLDLWCADTCTRRVRPYFFGCRKCDFPLRHCGLRILQFS
jgi:hypothetical protein